MMCSVGGLALTAPVGPSVLVAALDRPVLERRKKEKGKMQGWAGLSKSKWIGRKGQEVYMTESPCAARG